MSDPDLEQLFAEFRASGDPGALTAVFDRSAADLMALALHLVGDPATAEDVVQETFLAAMERSQRYQPGRPVMPWLVGILKNCSRRARRRRQRDAKAVDAAATPLVDAAHPNPLSAVENGEIRQQIRDALAALPDPYRTSAALRLVDGLSLTEIGTRLGQPTSTVHNRVYRGIEMLRSRLSGPALAALVWMLSAERLAAMRQRLQEQAEARQGTTAGGTNPLRPPLHLAISATLLLSAVLGLWTLGPWGGDPGRDAARPAQPPGQLGPAPGRALAPQEQAGRASGRRPLPAAAASADWCVKGRLVSYMPNPGRRPEEEESFSLRPVTEAARIEVFLLGPDGRRSDLQFHTQSAADGSFRIDLNRFKEIPALARIGTTVEFTVTSAHFILDQSWETAPLPATVGEPFTEEVQLQLSGRPAYRIEGRLLKADGTPFAGEELDGRQIDLIGMTTEDGHVHWGHRGSTYSWATEFPCTARLIATVEGYGVSEPVEVELSKTVPLVRRDIRLVPRGAPLRARVEAADGRPIPAMEIELRWDPTQGQARSRTLPFDGDDFDLEQDWMSLRADAQGLIATGGLVPGRYLAHPGDRLGRVAPPTLHTDRPDQAIRFSAPILRVRACDHQGRPAPGAELTLLCFRGAAAEAAREQFDRTGEVRRLRPLASKRRGFTCSERDATQCFAVEAGAYVVIASGLGELACESVAVLVDGAEAIHNVTLSCAARTSEPTPLRLSLRGEGKLACSLNLFEPTTGSNLIRYHKVMRGPQVGWERLPPGRYILRIAPFLDGAPCRRIEREVQIESGRPWTGAFPVEPAASFALLLTFPPGKRPPYLIHTSATLTVTHLGSGETQICEDYFAMNGDRLEISGYGQLNKQPRQVATGFAPGLLRVRVEVQGYQAVEQNIALRQGAVPLLTAVLEK